MAQLTDDCFAFDGGLLPIDDAMAMIAARVTVAAPVEPVGLHDADGRVLAEDIVAGMNLPGFDNSAVDGYAVRFDDLDPVADTGLRLVDRIAAGHRPDAVVTAGTSARIFTGAILPEGADTVIMQEDCVAEIGRVIIRPGIKRGANTRRAGEDVRLGSIVLRAGRRLGPADIGVLAALGLTEIPVRGRLCAALFSTGDEVREPGKTLAPGQIYDANRFMVASLLKRLDVAVTDCGILPDREEAVADALVAAARGHDLIVTSGGVSTGEEDHVRAAIEGNGALAFWRLAIKPGRPVALGQIGATPLIGLPGNPVAALITFVTIGRRLIEALGGATPHEPRRFPAVSGFAYRKRIDRREYVRVSLEPGDGELPRARRFPRDGAGMLSSLTETDGLAVLPEPLTRLEPGETIEFIPYSELI